MSEASTESSGGGDSNTDQTAAAEQLNDQKKQTRRDVTKDADFNGAGTGGSLPGSEGFQAISGIAPFLFLVCLYSDRLYARRKSSESKFDAFASDHKIIVSLSFLLDWLLRIILVAVVVFIILKGVAPLPNPADLFSESPAGQGQQPVP